MRSSPSNSSHRAQIGVVLLTLFIDLVGFSIIFPLYPGILEYYFGQAERGLLHDVLHSIGFNPNQSLSEGNLTAVLFGGFLGSIYALLQFVSAPFWGSLSDKVGRRKILLLTMTGTAFSYLLWIFSGSFECLLISRLIGGLMAGNLSVATAAVADLTTRAKRSSGMALVGIAFGLGFLFGPALGSMGYLWNPSAEGALLSNLPGINPFSGAAIIAFTLSALNLLWAYYRLPETKTVQESTSEEVAPWKRLLAIFTIPGGPQRYTHLAYFVFMLSFSGLEFSLTFLAAERFQYTPTQMVYIFLTVGLLLLVAQGMLVRRLVRKTGERAMMWGGIVTTIVGYWILADAHTQFLFYTALALISLGFGAFSPCITALVSLYADAREQGGRIGTFRSIGSLARAMGPFTLAFLYFLCGARTSYLLASILILLALLLTARLPAPDIEQRN
jgi:MFS family permease